jgi:hypothetical protein
MNTKRKFHLNSGALEYIIECLEHGHTLARFLLETQDLLSGTVFTFADQNINPGQLMDFKRGGIVPANGVRRYISANDGSRYLMVAKSNTVNELTSVTRDYLRAHPSNICIFEDPLASSSDPLDFSFEIDCLIYNEEVYYSLERSDSENDKVLNTINEANSSLLIGVMTKSPEFFVQPSNNKKNITVSNLESFAAKAEIIVVGAYDGEGFLIWNKSEI